jgi:F-type H+-transporting ATPase subunit alpha
MSVADQVMIIYAAVNDYLADIDVKDVQRFERLFLKFMREHKPEVGKAIAETGMLEPDVEKELKAGIEEFKKEFTAFDVDAPRDTSATKGTGGIESQVIQGA